MAPNVEEHSAFCAGLNEGCMDLLGLDAFRSALHSGKQIYMDRPTRHLVVSSTFRGPVKVMNWYDLLRLASPRSTIRPVKKDPANAKEDTKEMTIVEIGDQTAWRTREKDDWRSTHLVVLVAHR
ncbi:hypothetical protein N7471_001927 [Penicillium samsonianum]|uniref:uncharacterized protein n=1 Tax=Penicillium samsonianum TaxID=1882272 RepID=UPI002548B401|nr:uncharacterized protein N7471_001927 [Penicillium samsonianum]KAJ6142474.1 hypothetical protein N7471_001927 [Penicillium samsonianum]